MLLSDRALKYLVSGKLLDVSELKKLSRQELPSKISVRAKRKMHGEAQAQEFLDFVECYARYLLFKSKRHFPGLIQKCHTFQKMAAKGNVNPRSGLIRCILGCKPGGSREKQRRVVSVYHAAFSRLAKSGMNPAKLATSGKSLTEILYPRRAKQSAQNLQTLGFKLASGEYGLVFCRGTSIGQAKVLDGLKFGSNQQTADDIWRIAKQAPTKFKSEAIFEASEEDEDEDEF